jgi:hypothetical protein
LSKPNKLKKRDTGLALRNHSFYSDECKTTKRKLKAKNTKPTLKHQTYKKNLPLKEGGT